MPKNLLEKYSNPNIHFFNPIFGHDELIKKFFLTCDIFAMPTHADTFGMVFLEAQACGMPVVATNQFAVPEIIQDGETGFLIDSDSLFLKIENLTPEMLRQKINEYKEIDKKIVYGLIERLEKLIGDKNLRDKMRSSAVKLFSPGKKFSIQARNAKMERIFNQAVNEE